MYDRAKWLVDSTHPRFVAPAAPKHQKLILTRTTTIRKHSSQKSNPLEQLGSNLLQERNRNIFGKFSLFKWGNTCDEIHLFRSPDLCPLRNFPPKVQSEEEWDIDILYVIDEMMRSEITWISLTCCQESSGFEVPEYGKSIYKNECCCPEHSPISKIRLESAVIREFRAIEPLDFHTVVCRIPWDELTEIWKKTHRSVWMSS